MRNDVKGQEDGGEGGEEEEGQPLLRDADVFCDEQGGELKRGEGDGDEEGGEGEGEEKIDRFAEEACTKRLRGALDEEIAEGRSGCHGYDGE